LVPVNVRADDERNTLGNRVAAWIVSLPVGEQDPSQRLATLSETTSHLKRSGHHANAELLTGLTEWTGQSVLSAAIRLAFLARPFNLVVTNVPGPQLPLYLLDAKMLAVYPQVPLFLNQNLGVALFSYNERLYWGFNADRDQVPDLPAFVDAVRASFLELCGAAKIVLPAAKRRPPVRIAAPCSLPRRPAPRPAIASTPFMPRAKTRSTVRALHG
jgi:hypothetical protein